MSRKSEFQNENPNPAKMFLEWKSNDKTFSFYDKEKKENVLIELPFKFLTLMEMHTVKGWNDASESAIYSNEVKFIGTEQLTVKSFKGGEIAKGLYKEIKGQILQAGGHYTKSVYIMLTDGSVANLQLKGSAVREWGEFTKKTRSRLSDEWVEVSEFIEMKKGSITYTVPTFLFNTSLSSEEDTMADEAYEILKEYMSRYKQAPEVEKEVPILKEAASLKAPEDAFEDFLPEEEEIDPFS